MRMLADNPSIEFLRREAKDLLGALRESDAHATLADAQRAIADMYGFRTWSDLKAEVDRRREALPEAPAGLAEGVGEAFGLGAIRGAMTPIRYEHMGRRWSLETERGRFMVSPVFDWIDDGQAEVSVDLIERARAAGVLAPVPVRTPEGGLVRRVVDQSWRVDRWMDLGPTPVRPVHSSVAHQVGELLATLHDVAPRTDRPVEGPWITRRPAEASWAALVHRARASKKPWADEFAALSRTVSELSKVTPDAPAAPAIITNCDIVPEGVRFGPGGDLVVVHWDFAGPLTAEWELASVLLQWAMYSERNLEAARALMDGYRARSGGESPALTLRSFNVAITGWLNWAHNQACEAIDPRSEEKAEFAERALRETLDDPLTVAKLSSFLDGLVTPSA